MDGVCIIPDCKTRFKDKGKNLKYGRSLDSPSNNWLKQVLSKEGLNVESGSKLCLKCYMRYLRKRPRPDSKEDTHSDNESTGICDSFEIEDSPTNPGTNRSVIPLIQIKDLKYASSSHRKCSLCLEYNDNCINIPKSVRHSLIIECSLWCPPDARVCSEHLIGSFLHPDTKINMHSRIPLESKLNESISPVVINDLLEIVHEVSKHETSPKLKFETLSDSDCHAWTGWTLVQFQNMYDMCESDLVSGSSDSSRAIDLLLYFWAKLKTNLSWNQMTMLTNLSQATLSRYFHTIADILNTIVVPKYLGTNHISRHDAITHNTVFTKAFYGDQVTLILDGTYIYLNKCSDHQFQRASYGGQKKRNYLKFMSVVLPDGYVLDTIGPYHGNVNDATITRLIMEKIEILKSWLEANDNMIVDRGFRDALDLLAKLGYDARMPSFLPTGKSQLDSSTANSDRCCTKTRWIVESYHGRLKKWMLFKEQLTSNYFVEVIGKLVRIVTACLNAFRGPIYVSDPDREERDTKMAQRMLSLLKKDNVLAKRVAEDPNMSRRARSEWQKLEASDISFPHVDLEYLETITCGTYQIKQSPGYIAEHQKNDGDYEIWVYQHDADLIRGQIHSRHRSQIKYNVWIQFDKNASDDPVKAYYCLCPAGKRTSGMCAHVASVIYYLGYYKHFQNQKPLQPYTSKFKDSIL